MKQTNKLPVQDWSFARRPMHHLNFYVQLVQIKMVWKVRWSVSQQQLSVNSRTVCVCTTCICVTWLNHCGLVFVCLLWIMMLPKQVLCACTYMYKPSWMRLCLCMPVLHEEKLVILCGLFHSWNPFLCLIVIFMRRVVHFVLKARNKTTFACPSFLPQMNMWVWIVISVHRSVWPSRQDFNMVFVFFETVWRPDLLTFDEDNLQ